MDELLREAMEPILRDLRGSGVAQPRVEDDNWTGDRNIPSATLRSLDGTGTGVFVSRSASTSERIAAITDQVQEWVIDEEWGETEANWPPCPQHPGRHPLSAVTHDGTAVWACPDDDTVIAEIGSL